MIKTKMQLKAVETYFTHLKQIRLSGGATPERSQYIPLANLLNTIGATLKPKVFCVGDLADQGAGHPDFGIYTAHQLQKGQVRVGQMPERGVLEVKSVDDDAFLTAASDQVSKYWNRYRLVIVTNLRDFVLLGKDALGCPVKLETFQLAKNPDDFHRKLETPRIFAREVGAGVGEYLCRALSYRVTLTEPKDVAWLLASYARDGLSRIEAVDDTSSLTAVRKALEESLGVRFEGEKGQKFFYSTLVQTLFYGIFSAWVLWSRDARSNDGPIFEGSYNLMRFNWREAVWYLHAPFLRALFQQLSDPGRLQSLDLIEVLDWTADTMNRIDRTIFFSRFDEGEVVPYFYEPFLEAFDFKLRKQLGVWYTPAEVVRYMVARVDLALKNDLGIADGLAAENVYVLDPCCGTGAYLAEVLRRIAENLEGQGLGALVGARVKRAATERVFGFEIMPAPFVVAHLQVELTAQDLDAQFADDGTERPAIFLTNALTGWEPRTNKPLPFPEFEEERDRAERVKQEAPILVILGNPPYNGFADMAVTEERELSEAYRSTKQVQKPEGRGLNDLYVRFFRMADRRIVEKTGRGVICFISNYSWLDGLSFTGMRERYLEAFDVIRIDCLNGDRFKTGKIAPDGSSDPSIFSTDSDSVGIQVGTAIATLVRKVNHVPADVVGFRHLWGATKRAELTATAEDAPDILYESIEPVLQLGLPFVQTTVSEEWFDWPTLPELFPVSFPGVNTSRDRFLVDIDLNRLRTRISDYFDAKLNHEDIAQRYPIIMKTTAHYNARTVRDALLLRGGPDEASFIRYAHRPFDNRWLYWESDSGLLNRPRPNYRPHVFEGNIWLSAAQHLRKGAEEPQSYFTVNLGSMHLIERGALMFPAWLYDSGIGIDSNNIQQRPNLTVTAQRYLERLNLGVEDLFHHVLAVLHDPGYREANSGALSMEWPRIPIPDWPDGWSDGAREALIKSASAGRNLACLLDPDLPVPGITESPLMPGITAIAVPTTKNGRNMSGEDFTLMAGWGYFGLGDAVMPGKGRVVERLYSSTERVEYGNISPLVLSETVFDVYLNDNAYWRSVPATVWAYKLGGYQVLKKWLSYRERDVLGRALAPEEVQHFTGMARRIAAILARPN